MDDNKHKYDKVAKWIDIIDTMPTDLRYTPTVEDLKAHRVEERIEDERMAQFLLYIQACLPQSKKERTPEEEAVFNYITEIFSRHTK